MINHFQIQITKQLHQKKYPISKKIIKNTLIILNDIKLLKLHFKN